MLLSHLTSRRPACWLALSLVLIAVLIFAACGTSSQPDPATPDATVESHGATSDGESPSHADHATPGNDTVGQVAPADAVVINLPVVARATTLTRNDLRVTQGETIRLSVTADEPGQIHLHGYDLTTDVSPDSPGELVFEATTAGAFSINYHVFAGDGTAQDSESHGDHQHGAETQTVESSVPIGVSITAEPDANGGIAVHIVPDGFRFAPELVDQPDTPGAGHAHIYMDGVKLGRVFEHDHHIADVSPGDHEIRVSLNTNDHAELTIDGSGVEDIVTVTVPDVGQHAGHGHTSDDTGGHDHGEHQEIVAEVHLGNLEVYP